MKIIFMLLICLIFAGCSVEKQPIDFGHDKCSHCTMTITEPNWGAELVSDKGKVYKFDSIECLIAFELLAIRNSDNINFKYFWTVYFNGNKELLDAKKAYYLRSKDFHSPMGMNIASFKTENDLIDYKKLDSSFIMNYSDVVKAVKAEWGL